MIQSMRNYMVIIWILGGPACQETEHLQKFEVVIAGMKLDGDRTFIKMESLIGEFSVAV
jgi:hypothetical protein